jgi:hypothetical protein
MNLRRGYPRRLRGRAALLALVVAALLAPGTATASTADVIAPQSPPEYSADDGWQAGTCEVDTPICSVETKEQFFETAAAHPPVGFTQFIVKHGPPGETPVAELKRVLVDLPVGLSVNPGATPRCPLATFEAGASGCPAASKVGESFVTAAMPLFGTPIEPIPGVTEVPVYNLIPVQGEPARFGLELAGNEVFLEAGVAWENDYHEYFEIEVPKALPLELPGELVQGLILKNRLVFDGRSGDGTFITTPSTCLGEAGAGPGRSGTAYSTFLHAGSYEEFEGPGYQFPASAAPAFESPIPPGTSPKECASIPYAPSVDVEPGTAATNSPAGAAVAIEVPHLIPDFDAESDEQDSSTTRVSTVTLPAGMGINPSAANGLATCSDAAFGKGTRNPIACPPAARIGSVTIQSPPLPEGDLAGSVFVGDQLSRDPLSGEQYRIFIAAESARYGISVRLVGKVRANPVTGQLATTISEVPPVPFTSVDLRFDGGPRAVLSSPPTCGPNRTDAQMVPWAPIPAAVPADQFALTATPGGGACASSMAARAFAPAFALAPQGNRAGAYSPLSMRIARPDGQQELKGVDVTLPPGLTGKLASVAYCPETAIAAAAQNPGRSERAASSCPAASHVGSAAIAAGTGPAPLRISDGKAFLAGPFNGAPLSLAVITPATAGPFDLGTVVVRVALFVDPETARIRAVSEPIPDVYGGTQLSLRSVDVALDRPDFTLNPTSCEPLAGGGALRGGGADPANPTQFSSFGVAVAFQTSACEALKFRPKLNTRIFGGKKKTKRGQEPKFRAVLSARGGDANIRRAALTLSHALILEQGHIRKICTNAQLAASACPKRAIYGHAIARSPLLDKPLRGPVYLVPTRTDGGLPDLLADLRGQVNIQLRGVIGASKGRLRTVFPMVPDVPVSKFVLTMKGGKRGLLTNTRDLCKGPVRSFLNLKGQNGKKLVKKKLPLRVPACKAGKKRANR